MPWRRRLAGGRPSSARSSDRTLGLPDRSPSWGSRSSQSIRWTSSSRERSSSLVSLYGREQRSLAGLRSMVGRSAGFGGGLLALLGADQPQLLEGRDIGGAVGGELVVHGDRASDVDVPLNQVGILELAQANRQDAIADAGDVLQQPVESARPLCQGEKDFGSPAEFQA